MNSSDARADLEAAAATAEVDGIPSGDAATRQQVTGGRSMAWMRHTVPTPRREVKHRAVAALRALAADLVHADTEACNEDDLARLEELLVAARRLSSALPDHRAQPVAEGSFFTQWTERGSAATAPGDDAALFERSPLSGRSNALAAPLVLSYDEEQGITRGQATFGDHFEGPPGTVHGGYVVAAFDDVVGVAQVASGFAGRTARLAVDLRAPTPLHERIDFEAHVDRVEGRKIWVRSTSYHDGRLLAEAEGLLIGSRRPDTV